MQIESAAGEFDFDVTAFETEESALILVGKMGAWEARTEITESDLIKMIGLAVRSGAVWRFSLRLPVLLIKGILQKPSIETAGSSNE